MGAAVIGAAPETPAYILDEAVFRRRAAAVSAAFEGRIPLVYSIKANAFLLHALPEELRHVEVCSPGELALCERLGVAPEKIIYSGVMKEAEDIARAIRYGADILTAESPEHYRLICEQAAAAGITEDQPLRLLLRFTSGNQFGMSGEELCHIVKNRREHPELALIGIHYYSGTQKKLRQIEKDLARLEALLTSLREEAGFEAALVEYGPGLPADYFEGTDLGAAALAEEWEMGALRDAAARLLPFAGKYPLSVELGRFLASPCGEYHTAVRDIKRNDGTDYVILDGGIHQLRYYGQTLSMQVPELHVLRNGCEAESPAERRPYCLCGSLCTVADVLVREAQLPTLAAGDELVFGRCGAYSLTEGSALFLTRQLPAVYLRRADGTLERKRAMTETCALNA
ncbi:diaminopimelate decarboxylase family protein [Lachnoclostridium sp. Marseille-P6806]|uniref:diaminopimelate decarboxylase family protein n=1 Tax=Lachnoclostridium sp. Marseille-P6806 TaxID=2364793 RepID=UPI00103095C1|nr:alanine racemase [Lachnoclostridium sp. Marseille-P6806]